MNEFGRKTSLNFDLHLYLNILYMFSNSFQFTLIILQQKEESLT